MTPICAIGPKGLRPIADISVMRLFSFMMSLPTMSFGDGFCFSRNSRIGAGGWVGAPEGCKQHGLISRSDLVGTGRAISLFFDINVVTNKQSDLVGPPFPAFKACFSATAGYLF